MDHEGKRTAEPVISAGHFWFRPPADLALSSNDIHVWRASLDQPEACLRRLTGTLSADEQARAERFYFEQHRKRFIAARGILRMILARYGGIAPRELVFSYGSWGKPALKQPAAADWLRFNLAHSEGMALYAISRGREIGIDLEWIRLIAQVEQIAGRFFSTRENAVLEALPAEVRLEAFFTCWTRKEAYIKARGEGLSFPLDQFHVSLAPGEPARLREAKQAGPADEGGWFLQALLPGPGYVGALAAQGDQGCLQLWQWSEDL